MNLDFLPRFSFFKFIIAQLMLCAFSWFVLCWCVEQTHKEGARIKVEKFLCFVDFNLEREEKFGKGARFVAMWGGGVRHSYNSSQT